MSAQLNEPAESLDFPRVSETHRQMMLQDAIPATEEVLAEVLDIDVRYHWAQDALCAQTDPEIFFPDQGESIREAVRICSQCPVRQECFDAAMEEESARSGYGRYGIRGGVTARERSRIANGSQALQRQRTLPTDPPDRLAA